MKFLVAAALAAGVALTTTAASAQTLGDLAKREEARRKTVKTPSKVYTNEDLRGGDSSPAPDAAAPAAPAADATQPPAANQQPAQQTPPADDQKKDEAYWKDRLKQTRDALDRAKTFADALQSRINALTTDFTARSDPAQRAVIEQDRKKAVAELDRVNQEIKDNTKAISDIQEEARKAGVPASWYR